MITNAMIVISFVLAAFFPLAYSRSQWHRYLPGKALMVFSWIVTVVLGLSAYRALTGDFAPDLVRNISYVLIIAGLAMMDAVLLREQYRDQQQRDRERDREVAD